MGKITNYNRQCGKTVANKNIEEELMKKFLKFGAVLTALVLGLVCFAACGEEEDDGGNSNNGGYVSNNGGGSTNNSGGNTNAEEEKPRVTVVAEWISDDNRYTYIFYSDKTYVWKERTDIKEKGTYYSSSSPNKRGDITMSVKEEYDKNSGQLIPNSYPYGISILKNNNGELYIEDEFGYYTLNQ